MVHNAINPPPSLPSLQPPETHPVCPNHSLSCGSLNGWITQTNMALVTSCPTKALVCSSMREHISVCVTNASTYFYLFIFFLHGFCWLNLHNHSITTAFIVLFFLIILKLFFASIRTVHYCLNNNKHFSFAANSLPEQLRSQKQIVELMANYMEENLMEVCWRSNYPL